MSPARKHFAPPYLTCSFANYPCLIPRALFQHSCLQQSPARFVTRINGILHIAHTFSTVPRDLGKVEFTETCSRGWVSLGSFRPICIVRPSSVLNIPQPHHSFVALVEASQGNICRKSSKLVSEYMMLKATSAVASGFSVLDERGIVIFLK